MRITPSELDVRIRSCRLCAGASRPYGVEPRPIFRGTTAHRVMLLGQAPGQTEYDRNAPFQGPAGQNIRHVFFASGLADFEQHVYQTSVTKCFPGRAPGASNDRQPTSAEVGNCTHFLREQIALVQPSLIVCLGSLAWRTVLGLIEAEHPGFLASTVGVKRISHIRIPNVVGKCFNWNGALVLPMIHPAGTANGSRGKHPAADAQSKALLRRMLQEIGLVDF
jgi:uracil-DNA glycosylase